MPEKVRQGRKKLVKGWWSDLHRPDQFILGYGHDKSVVHRAGVVILCTSACMQQRGLIDFRERGTKATSYRIVVAGSVQTDSYMSESKQESVQDGVQNGKQNSAHDGVQDSTQESKHAIDSIYNNLNTKRQKTKDISPAEHFEEFLSAYPKECSRYLTETAYYDLLLAGKVSEKELVQCAVNYADWCRILGKNEQFIKNGENFLKEFVFEKYLPGNYKKPKPPAKNSFTSFPQNDYDFDQLEKEILSN